MGAQFHIFLSSALDAGEGWGQIHTLAVLLPAKFHPGTNFIGGCVGPKLDVNDVEKIM